MNKYLVRFSDCYADEFDVNEAAIITAEQLRVIRRYLAVDELKYAREVDERNGDDYQEEQLFSWFDDFRFCYSFGTNEELEYERLSGMEEIWDCLKIIPITDAEIAVVKKFDLVEDGGYGFIAQLLREANKYVSDSVENEKVNA